MTFKKYLKAMKKLAKKHPEALAYTVVVPNDPDANTYRKVLFVPQLGARSGNDFHPVSSYEEWGISEDDTDSVSLD